MKKDNAMATSSFESPESSVLNVSENKTNGTRLSRLLIDGGTHALRKYFDTIHPPENLEDELNNNKRGLQPLRNRRVISESQWDQLFPFAGDPPDSKTFDITLLHLLLREICHLTAPSTGWHNMPADDDTSPEASITKIKCCRNELCHSISTGVSNDVFEASRDNIASSLVALGLDQQEVDHLKTDPIDHDTQRRLEEEVKRLNSDYKVELREVKQNVQELQDKVSSIQESMSSLQSSTSTLSSCLPDELPGGPLVGRSEEIQRAVDAVQSGKVSIVQITGGPGFGKTTVANKVAHVLAKPECGRTVLCCPLGSKRTLNGVATEMILACGKSSAQPTENPVHWLKSWCSHANKQVTFVLDNVDDILDSEDRERFLRNLSEMRTLSRQNVTFVVTSRNAFNTGTLQIEQVRLHCLSPEKAKELLLSQAPNLKNFSKAEELAELSGRVPLALCLIGSLLSDYNEDKLIQRLQEDPLSALQDGEISVEKAIKTSFDLLDESEKQALILMSVFPGSFDSDAAEAVMRAYPQAQNKEVSILRSLKNRSLVEQPGLCRYQIHLLIQAFVKTVGQDPILLPAGKTLACAHFISRLACNSGLYWSKDTCKLAMMSYNEDRHNFEYFLKVFLHGLENQDPDIVATTKTLLDNIPQQCMYLERCLLPSTYRKLLESLLKYLASDEQPVHKVDLLCLLGHESRKVRGQEYKKYMGEAIQVHSENRTEIKPMALSEVLFRNTYSRFLSEEKDQKGSKNQDVIALKVCREQLGDDHPETASTLLFAGRNAKRRKAHNEAETALKKALESFRRCLGNHVMTAQALKELADFYFSPDKSFGYYTEALQMMEELGLDNHKECVLILKNFAVCLRTKGGNLREAMHLLERANQIAQRELEEDHKWKFMVKTELNLLHRDMQRSSRGSAARINKRRT